MSRVFLALLFATWPVALSVAQDAASVPAARPADVETVDGVIKAVYDIISGAKGEERNWDRFRSLFRPEAKLIPSWRRPD